MPVVKKQPTRKRLVRGRDWHAWAWKPDKGVLLNFALLCQDSEQEYRRGVKGRWVRVLFTEVPAAKRSK